MEMLSELRTNARKNIEKIECIERKCEKRFLDRNDKTRNIERSVNNYRDGDGYRVQTGKYDCDESSFSVRMIAVMLLLAVTMFLKQETGLADNDAYQSVMAEIHKQVSIEDVNEAVDAISLWKEY